MAKKPYSKILCKLSELGDLSSKSFSVKIKRKETDIFVIRKDDQVYAYQNICPHAQAPLEWNPDEFLDEKKETIICALHGARFSIEKGDCLGGPCEGIGLTDVSVDVFNGDVVFIG
jgi:nitrite reductase/ring-hydroxylating ferredoxin subunit